VENVQRKPKKKFDSQPEVAEPIDPDLFMITRGAARNLYSMHTIFHAELVEVIPIFFSLENANKFITDINENYLHAGVIKASRLATILPDQEKILFLNNPTLTIKFGLFVFQEHDEWIIDLANLLKNFISLSHLINKNE
jgi:hypothetical protein